MADEKEKKEDDRSDRFANVDVDSLEELRRLLRRKIADRDASESAGECVDEGDIEELHRHLVADLTLTGNHDD